MKDTVNIGTSGFSLSQSEYVHYFSCVEIQQTFYQPPSLITLGRWRKKFPYEFEFTLKAWQLITHEAKSPTYKRLKRTLSEIEMQEAGYFKPTSIVKEAWDVTLACAKTLNAKTILFQCPASFKQTNENIANMKSFFSNIERENFNICWEPRGDWDVNVLKNICDELKLCHVVDPFAAITVTRGKYYFRLHGRKSWKYKYEDVELEELAEMLQNCDTSYVFFNNIFMTEDAMRFKQILQKNHH